MKKSALNALLERYSFIRKLRREARWSRTSHYFGLKLPRTRVYVRQANAATMHFQARNSDGLSSYMLGPQNRRGAQTETAYAMNANHQRIGSVSWHSGDKGNFTRYLRDMFLDINPNDVAYLLWTQVVNWFDPPSATCEDTKCLGTRVGCEFTAFVLLPPENETWAELAERADREKKERDEAYLYPPKETPAYPAIHAALAEGGHMYAFTSGGGLRVLSIERDGRAIGYGEHPHVESALRILEDDVVAGHRPYGSVYGKLEPHYLTGASLPTSNIDSWIRYGSTFDCCMQGGEVVFVLNGYEHHSLPDNVKVRVLAGEWNVRWCWRGHEFESRPSHYANGDIGVSTGKAGKPKPGESDPWMWKITKMGRGTTIWEAMRAAFAAPSVEVTMETVQPEALAA